MRSRLALLVGISLAATACGPGGDRYTFGDYSVSVPTGWHVQTEPDENGFNVIEPPSGSGRIAFIEVTDKNPPAEVAEAYALDHSQRGISSAGLSTDGLAVQSLGANHYIATAEGLGGGEHVVAAVHVFAPGRIVIGYFHTPDPQDSNNAAAAAILRSVTPV